ncbi:MAG: aminotransferase class I/II-fold pyridoxal phosphate-dependent enzyme [Steroidobacteraceae bacterium]|jgi:8-amino-7-oxononanoate synthase
MSGPRKVLQGLTAPLKERLIQDALQRRLRKAELDSSVPARAPGNLAALQGTSIPDSWCRFDLHPNYQQLRILNEGADKLGVSNPFFRMHDGLAGATTVIEGETFTNFSSYNYLGLCGHPDVNAAAKAAIDRYGTSASASRLVSGERPIHRELERAIADLHGVDDCVVFVSGHATNVSTIGHLFGPRDLIVHDALIHNSALLGSELSGARRMPFAHNDWEALDQLLTQCRLQHERVLIVVEGLYSMDGDVPDLPRFVEIKRRHRAFLMVDEAHSVGVLGRRGLGVQEHFGLDGSDVDIWMGTLSKTLASCGGYIAGEHALVEHLKCAAPGFVYSVAIPPSAAAAALAALRVLQAEPQRVQVLQARGRQFLQAAQELGVDTGLSIGLSVIPAITHSSLKAARLSEALFRRKINVQPIVYPAVQERGARLRFFISSEHTEAQIRTTVEALAQEIGRL